MVLCSDPFICCEERGAPESWIGCNRVIEIVDRHLGVLDARIHEINAALSEAAAIDAYEPDPG